MLGIAAAQGRTFVGEEDRPGANHVVVLSHELWQRRFGGDPQLIGQSLTLNSESYTVIGVMPADFRLFAKTDLWTPLAFSAADENDPAGSFSSAALNASGVHKSVFANSRKSAGITPITVYDSLFSVSDCPIN